MIYHKIKDVLLATRKNFLRKILYPKEGLVFLNYNENIILQDKSDKNKSLHITCNS